MEEQVQIQMEQLQMPTAAAAGIGIGAIIIWLVMYVFFAFCLAHMATKLGRPFGKSFVMALIPIVNVFWFFGLAGKPWWFGLLALFVPIANIVVWILGFMSIAEKRGYPNWYGIMLIIPLVGIVFFFILVFGKGGKLAPATA